MVCFLTRITFFSYEFHELTNFSNLECSRLDVFDYEFYELSNFSNLEY